MKKNRLLFLLPYLLWIGLFVIAPLVLILGYSLTDAHSHLTLQNFAAFFSGGTFLRMMANSFWYALLITFFCLLVSYPAALALTRLKNQQFWLMLIILPTWINLLLKAYAFIGIFSRSGMVNQFLGLFVIGPVGIMFTDFAFIFVAIYIEIPFMVMPIYNSLKEIDPALLSASSDLGASFWQTFRYVIWPLSWPGVESGIQAIFIPSLSLFMLTRLIGGNRVITLGTAVEEYFLTTMNWNMGATIGVILIALMSIVMLLTSRKQHKKEFEL
ncbi:ABC transporter permease subunit [Lactobacillus delbrueckii subsp. bulgaricus]|nr:spermidine/putrescine ABC transporter permease [Lactobacillus delbrueckii subsp. bulgaricus]